MVAHRSSMSRLGVPGGRARRPAVVLAASAVLGLIFSGTAQAGVVTSDASECLTGEAGPYDLVAAAFGPWPKPIFLSCGDRTKGVLHIDMDHPIADDGSDDEALLKCFKGVVYGGDEVPANVGNRALARRLPDGTSAVVVWDPKIDEVVTMFTTGERSNRWRDCADDVGLWW